MQKSFKSRFRPNVKFKIPVECIKQFDFGLGFPAYAVTSIKGDSLSHVYCENQRDLFNRANSSLVSIYEAMPEFIPDGMRYNKELDKLVPDIVNVEFERVKFDDFSDKYEQINKRENGFIKADLNKIDFTLVDPFAYKDLGKQLTIGAEKYERDNWQKGDILTYLAALQRHLNDVEIALIENDFEKLIDDTGVNQGAALMFNSMAVHYFIRKILKDKNVK